MNKEFDLVIYHANCYDGMTSAWVARKAIGEVEFYAAHHYVPPPDVTGRRVLVSDFAYVPLEWTQQMADQADFLTILDHHKSTVERLEPLIEKPPHNVYLDFDMERSGAGITWDFFFPGEPRPPIVKHVEDRDLWNFKYPETKAYHAAMTRRPMTFESWDEMATLSVDEMVRQGEPILLYNDLIGEKLAARATTVILAGVLCWCVNAPVEFVGETAEHLKNRKHGGQYLPVLAWHYDGDLGSFYCSLRSRDDGIDVSDIAVQFGGGGHAHAAGFKIKKSLVGTIFPKTE